MKTIITAVILSVIFVAVLFWIVPIGMERNRKYECEKLDKYYREYPAFYYTEWQKDMCFK